MIKQLIDRVKFAAIAAPVYAESINITNKSDNFKQLETLTVGGILSGAISLVMLVVALIFFFMLVLGGLKWVMSEGEEKSVKSARDQITNALIGLAIVFAAWAIMKLIEVVFGIKILGGIDIPTFK
jgi:hypothetical protein